MSTSFLKIAVTYVQKHIKTAVFALIRRISGLKIITTSLLKKLLPNFRATKYADWSYLLSEFNYVMDYKPGSPELTQFSLDLINKELGLRHAVEKMFKVFKVKPSELEHNRANYNFTKWLLSRTGIPYTWVFEGGISFSTRENKYWVRFGGRRAADKQCLTLELALDHLMHYFTENGLTPNALDS